MPLNFDYQVLLSHSLTGFTLLFFSFLFSRCHNLCRIHFYKRFAKKLKILGSRCNIHSAHLNEMDCRLVFQHFVYKNSDTFTKLTCIHPELIIKRKTRYKASEVMCHLHRTSRKDTTVSSKPVYAHARTHAHTHARTHTRNAHTRNMQISKDRQIMIAAPS